MRRLLLLPLLAPLLAACLTGALNPRPTVSLRLLVWQTPALPLGAWLAAAAAAGAALSGGAAGLALREPSPSLRRQVRRDAEASGSGRWQESGRATRERFERESPQERSQWDRSEPQRARQQWQADPIGAREQARVWAAGPTRQPGAPPPTVAVPYRVLRRREPIPEPIAQPMAQPIAQPIAVADDWGEAGGEEW